MDKEMLAARIKMAEDGAQRRADAKMMQERDDKIAADRAWFMREQEDKLARIKMMPEGE